MPPRASRPVGIALLDKPAGPSSFALVSDLRRRTRARTGHAGTLDPFATGLLVLLSGLATRLAPCFVGLDKRYLTEVDLAATTSTGDPEGEVLERHPPPSLEELEARLALLRGEIELPIPAASAVKIGGERAYRLARQGIKVEMPLRRSQVYALDLITYSGDAHGAAPGAAEPATGGLGGDDLPDVARGSGDLGWTGKPPAGAVPGGARSGAAVARLALHVGSGTYVRSIAAALGGHCVTLRRTAVGPFAVDEADPERLIPVAAALNRLPTEALARVPEAVRAHVLAFEAEHRDPAIVAAEPRA